MALVYPWHTFHGVSMTTSLSLSMKLNSLKPQSHCQTCWSLEYRKSLEITRKWIKEEERRELQSRSRLKWRKHWMKSIDTQGWEFYALYNLHTTLTIMSNSYYYFEESHSSPHWKLILIIWKLFFFFLIFFITGLRFQEQVTVTRNFQSIFNNSQNFFLCFLLQFNFLPLYLKLILPG